MLIFPSGEILWLALAIVTGGAITGILAGLFGIGGGAIIVPVLYEVFRILGAPEDVRMQLCIGTSLAIIVPTTIRSYQAHRAKNAVLPNIVRQWTPPAVLGVAVGAGAAAFAPTWLFKVAFAAIAAFIAAKLLFARETWRLGAELPQGPLMHIYGFLVGLVSSLMGVSGGSTSNLVLTLYGKSIHAAVATSSGVGVPITIAGSIGYMIAGWRYRAVMPPLCIGFVSLIGFALMAPVSSYTAIYGARLAHWLPKRKLEMAFGFFLLLAAARFMLSLV